MLIPLKEINKKKKYRDLENTALYLLDNEILLKRFKHLDNSQRNKIIEKYEYAKKIGSLDGLILPIDVLETEKNVCGYVEKIIPGTLENNLTTFTDYLNNHQSDITLNKITEYILKCINIVKHCHKFNIVNPDLSTGGNVLYNPSTDGVTFTDYQDMQVSNIKTNNISDFIATDPILASSKYYKDGIYSPNIDIYTLAIRYFYFFSKINVPRAIQAYSIDELINLSGIENTEFAECMRIIYDKNIYNPDIENAVKNLNKNYELTPFKKGEVRKLIHK